MTLILNCLTQEYLFQVSDRRLVSLPTYKVEDDNANKSIYFAGRISFGYTGLAEIEGKKNRPLASGYFAFTTRRIKFYFSH